MDSMEKWSNREHDASEDMNKIELIEKYIINSGYELTDLDEIVNVIRINHIDISAFVLPYNCKTLDEWQQRINQKKSFLNTAESTMCKNKNHIELF